MGTRESEDAATDELEFELGSFEHLVETSRGHIVRVTGTWSHSGAGDFRLPHPSLVLGAEGEEHFIAPLPTPGDAPPRPDGETLWRASYSISKDRFARGRAPQCRLRVAPGVVFTLPELLLPEHPDEAAPRPRTGMRAALAGDRSLRGLSAAAPARERAETAAPAPAHAAPGLGEIIVTALRAHPRIVGAVVLLALAGALLGSVVGSPSYVATAQVYVKPLPSQGVALADLPDVRAGSDPAATLETAAALIRSRQIAAQTSRSLGGDPTPRKVLDRVSVDPMSGGDILEINATAGHAREAADLANTFARTAVRVRDVRLRRLATEQLTSARRQLDAIEDPETAQAQALQLRIAALRQIISAREATMSVAREADVPKSAEGLPALAVFLLTALAGLVLGVGAAVVADLVGGRRLGTVDDAVAVYPLEVLARVPHVRSPSGRGKTPALRPALREAFRTLAVQVTMREGEHGTMMLTSASQGDGKTTSAIAFALELAEAGHAVVLIDGDLRKPDVALRLGLHVEHGLEDVAAGRTPLEQALVPVPDVERLHVLAPSGPLPLVTVAGTGRTFDTLLAAAEEVADYVVLDTPPVGEVSDALTLAREADDVIVVCRLGHTTELQLQTASELLGRTQVAPTGLVIVG